MPLLDCLNQISKYTTCTCCGIPAGLFSHLLFDIVGELFLLQLSREFSVSKLKSPSRLLTIYRNTAFGRFEVDARAADVPHSFWCNERLIYRLQTCFRQSGSKNNKPPPGRPRITTSLESRVIVTSTWRNGFMVTRKLLKRHRHATGTRISVYTVKNRLRGASLIFEFWNLNFDVWFCWRKWVNFQNILLKMITLIGN